MSLITWKEEFSVGDRSVDKEHREMIELIADLDKRMQNHTSHDIVLAGLGEIYARIAAHFALEERIMLRANYAQFPSHKSDHEQLLDTLLNVIDSVDDAGHYDREALSKRLEQWFSEHFRTHDAKLHNQLG